MFNKNLFFTTEFISYRPALIILLVLFGFLILVASAILLLARGEARKILGVYIAPFYTVGALGYIYLFASYENLPWLDNRFFLFLIMFALLIWILAITIWAGMTWPKQQRKKKIEDKFNQYLPKGKKQKSR